jgi:hypothetical protein
VDPEELELTCPCGFENFERIVVQRRPHPPVVTDFVACVGCKTMYWAPRATGLPPSPSVRPSIDPAAEASSPGLKTWGGVPATYREHEQTPEELEEIKKAAARANKHKPKR